MIGLQVLDTRYNRSEDMEILIINGNLEKNSRSLDGYMEDLSLCLEKRNCQVKSFTLRLMNINYCIGCFSCWVKTPGKCFFSDDMLDLLISYLRSDVVILVSPVIMGFVSGVLKRALDRLLPLFHPYLTIKNNRFYHFHRYRKMPSLVVLLEKNGKTLKEDINILNEVFKGMNLNYLLTKTTGESVARVAYEITHI